MLTTGTLGQGQGDLSSLRAIGFTASVTGSAALATGLRALQQSTVSCNDSSTTTPISVATKHLTVGGTITVAVVDLTPVGPAIAVSAAPHAVDVIGLGS